MLTNHGDRPIAFPSCRDFNELFRDTKQRTELRSPSRTIARMPSWDSGEKGRRGYVSTLSGYLEISSKDWRRLLDTDVQPCVLDYFKSHCLHVPSDTMTFHIHVWDERAALVVLEYGQIIGSHYLAIIDTQTIPTFPEVSYV